MNRQYPLPLPHHEAMEADDFMVTSSNREAATWIGRWPDWPAHCLVIYGPPGSGKTHLAQMWQRRSGAQFLDLTNNDVGIEETPSPAKTRDLAEVKSEFLLPLPQGERSSADIFVLDDAEKIAGHAAQEEALFHLYNRLRETKGSLLLTAALAPAQWDIGLADLHSRLSSVPAIAISAPDDELLSALLIKQFQDRQIALGADVVEYLLSRTERSPAAIRDLVQALDHASLAEGRRITIALARKLLDDPGFLIR